MKIAIVLNSSWNIYNFRMNLVRSLLARGHEVHTIAPIDDYTHHLTEAGCEHHDVTMDAQGTNPVRDTALLVELFFIYRSIRPAMILHYTIKPNVYGSLAAGLLGIRTINNVCGLGTVFLLDSFPAWVAKMLYKFSFRYASKVFFQNPDDLSLFLEKGLIAQEKTDLVPGSGIDLDRFQPAPFKRNAAFTFLLISRLITDKGVLEFINAVKKLRAQGLDARFQVLGAKEPRHKRGINLRLIDDWIAAGTIEYLGVVSDVRQFIHQADCVVLPSYREGMPRTLLEAASSAKPIIATDVPGCRQIVRHNVNGLLCQLKNADDLAAKMAEMAAFDDVTLRRFGDTGREIMEREFSEQLVIDKYISTIDHVRRSR